MKYGLLVHQTTRNLGDDVQSYAIENLLPHVDYILDRENLDKFQSWNNEPVATVFAAWWMWKKYNWPPASNIIPLFISMHFNNYDVYEKSSPVTTEWIEQGTPGREYMEAYGPVGVRDLSSVEFLSEQGIDNYFSGCLTLTLPKQKETEDKGTYVVIADLRPDLCKAVHDWLEPSGLKVIDVTNDLKADNADLTWEERRENVIERLTLLQNAKFVVTRRLHVTLPCLAMEVPVISIFNINKPGEYTRWKPYDNWTHFVTQEDALAGKFDFDYNNPPANKDIYKKTRENLIQRVQDFVTEMESYGEEPKLEDVRKTTYTEEELKQFRYDLRTEILDKWLSHSRTLLREAQHSWDQQKKMENITTENKNLSSQNQKLKIANEAQTNSIRKRNKLILALAGMCGILLAIIILLILKL